MQKNEMFHVKHLFFPMHLSPVIVSRETITPTERRPRGEGQPQRPIPGEEVLSSQGILSQRSRPGDGQLQRLHPGVHGRHRHLVLGLPPQHQPTAHGVEIADISALQG